MILEIDTIPKREFFHLEIAVRTVASLRFSDERDADVRYGRDLGDSRGLLIVAHAVAFIWEEEVDS